MEGGATKGAGDMETDRVGVASSGELTGPACREPPRQRRTASAMRARHPRATEDQRCTTTSYAK